MAKRIDEALHDIKEIRKTLADNTFRLAEYNAQLEVHIQATKDLQARVKPIEEHVLFVRQLMRGIGWLFGVAASCATLARLLLK